MLTPIGDRVLLRVDEREEKVGSIFIPKTAKDDSNMTGIIAAVGKGKYCDQIEVGSHVIVAKMYSASKQNAQLHTSGFDCDIDGNDGKGYLMLDADQIIAVIG
jgi:co-chaperonin GroES (HSP10)